jgi:hypothetical protein
MAVFLDKSWLVDLTKPEGENKLKPGLQQGFPFAFAVELSRFVDTGFSKPYAADA